MGTGEPEEALEAKDELVQKEEVAETASLVEEAVEAALAEKETSTDEPAEDK